MRKVKFKLSIYRTSISVDLNEFGIEGKEWNDLTEAEQNEIRDSITEGMIIYCHEIGE